jgi:predicted nucleic acid-binding protein
MHVLDASALLKLVLDEPGSPAFRSWYAERAGEEFVAPALLFTEVGRSLQRARLAAHGDAKPRMHALLLGNVRLEADFAAAGAVERVWAALAASELTFMDAQYLALAQARKAPLVTADRGLAEAARRLDVAVVAA